LKKPRTSLPVAGAPNPQGKGLIGFLQDWDYTRPRAIVAKRSGQVLAEYFTALLVLSADFKFKPAYGQTCHLYRKEDGWQLSLVSPAEWNNEVKHRTYVGACVLHDDSTWTIEPSENLKEPGPVIDGLAEVYEGFLNRLNRKEPLESELPFYEDKLPYYQRLFAAALSRSLRHSLHAGGQLNQPGCEWLRGLPQDVRKMLGQRKP